MRVGARAEPTSRSFQYSGHCGTPDGSRSTALQTQFSADHYGDEPTVKMINQDPNAKTNNQINQNSLATFGYSKKWNGQPIETYIRDIERPITNALGRVHQDGSTLKECVQGVSVANITGRGHIVPNKMVRGVQLPLGVINGIPQVRATDAQDRQEELRNKRIFAMLMDSLETKCYLYEEAEQDFDNDGIALLRYMRSIGVKPYTPEKLKEMQNEWSNATIDVLKIPYGPSTIFDWNEWILAKAVVFQPEKGYEECYETFLGGLTHHLKAEANTEKMRPNAAYNFPVNYPAAHRLAGVAHPFAGQPDPRKYTNAFQAIWDSNMKAGLIRKKDISASVAEECDEDAYEYDESGFFVGRGKGKGGRGRGRGGRGNGNRTFDEKTRCYNCGGLGHIFRFTKDGVQMTCPTSITVSRDILNGIQYPHIASAPPSRANVAELPEDYNGPNDDSGEHEASASVAVAWWD